MEDVKVLYRKILAITMLIEEKYPELTKYLSEMPDTIPNESHPSIDEKALQDYYISLCDILTDYEIEHP